MRSVLIAVAVLFAVPSAARSAEAKTDPQAREAAQMHRRMAELHEKAADCVESGRPMEDCRAEAMKDCPMARTGDCPFKEGMGMKMGRKKGMGMRRKPKGMPEGMGKEEEPAPGKK